MKRYGRRSMGKRRYGRKSGLKQKRTIRRKRMARRRSTGIPRALILRNTNFPLGQRCFAKLSFEQQSQWTGNGAAPEVYSATFVANGLASPPKDGLIDNRASAFLCKQFANYKVHGMKYSLSAISIEQANTTADVDPLALIFIPWTPSSGPPSTGVNSAQLGYLRQFPGCKYKLISDRWARTWTTLKGYISMPKMIGRKIDDGEFVGTSTVSGTVWADPITTVQFKFGIININENGLQANLRVTYVMRTTFFVEFFNPSIHGIE